MLSLLHSPDAWLCHSLCEVGTTITTVSQMGNRCNVLAQGGQEMEPRVGRRWTPGWVQP